MNLNRTTIFAALFAAGIATGAAAQTSPSTTTTPTKPAAGTTTTAPGTTTATPAPPSAGSTGMDKGAGTGASQSTTTKSGSSMAKGSNSSLAGADRRFVEKAMQGGMAEVEAGKMAMDKAQDAQVKAFAKRMVDDHSKANSELTKIASAKGLTPPATVDGGHKRKMDRMAKRSGNDFDRAYMDDMVDDHQATVRDFRNAAKSAKDADVKAFASSTLPTLEQHLQEAKTLEASVKGRKNDSAAKSTTGTSAPKSNTTAPKS